VDNLVKFGVDPSITGPTQGPTTHRARTRPNVNPTRERVPVVANHHRNGPWNSLVKFIVDPSIAGQTQGPTTHRARTRPGQHFDPKREAVARYHPNIAREQPCQVSWRSDVVCWCYVESRQNGRTGPAGPNSDDAFPKPTSHCPENPRKVW